MNAKLPEMDQTELRDMHHRMQIQILEEDLKSMRIKAANYGAKLILRGKQIQKLQQEVHDLQENESVVDVPVPDELLSYMAAVEDLVVSMRSTGGCPPDSSVILPSTAHPHDQKV